jgi:hypothetical protein
VLIELASRVRGELDTSAGSPGELLAANIARGGTGEPNPDSEIFEGLVSVALQSDLENISAGRSGISDIAI